MLTCSLAKSVLVSASNRPTSASVLTTPGRLNVASSVVFTLSWLVLASSRTVHCIKPAPVVRHQPGRSGHDRQAACPRFLTLPIRLIEHASAVMGELSEDDLSFVHSGLCQTALPHQRLVSNDAIWQRSSGRFHLMISPGVIRNKEGQAVRVGVPYGTRARLIMIFLQSEGVRSRTVHLGSSMAAWVRSLGLAVSGGPRGTIQRRCSHWVLGVVLSALHDDGGGLMALPMSSMRRRHPR